MAYKQQPFIFHRYGDWRLKIRVLACQVLVEVFYQAPDCRLLTVASEGRRNKGALSGTSFIKDLVSFIRALPSWFNHPRGPPNTIMPLLLLFSCWDVSNSLWPQELQHTRLPWPSLSPWVCSNSRPLSWWCHLTISSSVTPFSSCLQSFPASWSFPMSQLFTSGGQSIGASALALVVPMNIQGRFPLGLIGLISCPRDSQESSATRISTYEFWADTNIHPSKGEIKEGVFGPSMWNIVIKHTKGPGILYT